MNNKTTKKLWFKRKTYGWGWVPVSWEGWLVILAYTVLIIDIFKDVDKFADSAPAGFWAITPRFFVLTLALIFICYRKGEKPKWTWGPDKETDREEK